MSRILQGHEKAVQAFRAARETLFRSDTWRLRNRDGLQRELRSRATHLVQLVEAIALELCPGLGPVDDSDVQAVEARIAASIRELEPSTARRKALDEQLRIHKVKVDEAKAHLETCEVRVSALEDSIAPADPGRAQKARMSLGGLFYRPRDERDRALAEAQKALAESKKALGIVERRVREITDEQGQLGATLANRQESARVFLFGADGILRVEARAVDQRERLRETAEALVAGFDAAILAADARAARLHGLAIVEAQALGLQGVPNLGNAGPGIDPTSHERHFGDSDMARLVGEIAADLRAHVPSAA